MNDADVEKIVRGMVNETRRKGVAQYESITYYAAEAVVRHVFAEAEKMRVRVFVAIADAGANPVAVARMDGAFAASYDIAVHKAYTAVALKTSTEALGKLAAPGGELYGIQNTNDGKIVIFGGGEPLRIGDAVVGGVGVSGGTLAQDIALGIAGRKYWEDVLCR